MQNFEEELRKVAYEPAKLLIKKLEENYDNLTIEQKRDYEKLKFGLKMYDLEQLEKKQPKQPKGGFRWA
jgi:hypothetical protein